MKLTYSAMLGFAMTVAIAGCSDNSAEDAANAAASAAERAADEADAAMARADAALASAGKTDAKTNGGMSNSVEIKTSAELNLRSLLKDPDSAKYRNQFLAQIDGGNLMLCGEVNSKNSFGGFTGFKRFIASPNPDAPSIVDGETGGISGADFDNAYRMVCSTPVERF